ncbi:MAG: hypothetical protein LBR91_03025, partial [Puniceicoccales bacterium]|nr:hypothetical protein [Puniceicoccales bacterium]
MKLFRKLFHRAKRRVKTTIPAGNFVKLPDDNDGRIFLRINGTGNSIKIGTLRTGCNRLNINITGNNNSIEIGDNFFTSTEFNVLVGQLSDNYGPANDVKIKIGNWVQIEGAWLSTFNSGAVVEIGDECMFSNEVVLMQTDSHPIFDQNGKIINFINTMKIGNHVWLGTRVAVLKNSHLADGVVVGGGSVVAGKFDEPNCVIAGNPARVVRHNIKWTDYSREYCRNNHDAVPNILSFFDTIEGIRNGMSIARFNDGEVGAMFFGRDFLFQKTTSELVKRLKEV